jgi:hypothetical protein
MRRGTYVESQHGEHAHTLILPSKMKLVENKHLEQVETQYTKGHGDAEPWLDDE